MGQNRLENHVTHHCHIALVIAHRVDGVKHLVKNRSGYQILLFVVRGMRRILKSYVFAFTRRMYNTMANLVNNAIAAASTSTTHQQARDNKGQQQPMMMMVGEEEEDANGMKSYAQHQNGDGVGGGRPRSSSLTASISSSSSSISSAMSAS